MSLGARRHRPRRRWRRPEANVMVSPEKSRLDVDTMLYSPLARADLDFVGQKKTSVRSVELEGKEKEDRTNITRKDISIFTKPSRATAAPFNITQPNLT